MNYDRIYDFRFRGVNSSKKKVNWSEISLFIYRILGQPAVTLDPAAGRCEFINSIPSKERWAMDLSENFIRQHVEPEIKVIVGDALTVELPPNYFDAVFVSNFLEHLQSQEEVAFFLERMYKCLKKGGQIAVMGPNFKYTYRNYFDFADHTVILSELGLSEHLYGAGFEVKRVHKKFLPLSFRGNLPVSGWLVRLYLKLPIAWYFFGKQFLVIATKE